MQFFISLSILLHNIFVIMHVDDDDAMVTNLFFFSAPQPNFYIFIFLPWIVFIGYFSHFYFRCFCCCCCRISASLPYVPTHSHLTIYRTVSFLYIYLKKKKYNDNISRYIYIKIIFIYVDWTWRTVYLQIYLWSFTILKKKNCGDLLGVAYNFFNFFVEKVWVV